MESEDKASLDCPVCMEEYDTGQRTPKMMPCLHTVCASCLHDLTTTKPASPGKAFGWGRHSIQPAVTPTISSDQPVYEVIDENPEVATRPPPPSHQQIPHPMQRMASGHLNSEAISNLASIMNGHPRTPFCRPESWSYQSKEELPPPLPARNRTATAPPLRPKPMIGSKPQLSPLGKEPDIPRNLVFQCPVCRSDVDSSKLQTNRYVLAHLRDLQRLNRQSKPSSPVCRSISPNVSQHEQAIESFVPENYWCNTCNKPCSAGCINHNHQNLQEYAQNVNTSLHRMVHDFEDRLVQHANSLNHTDASFKFVFQTLTKASRHLWRMNQGTQELKEKMAALRESISNNKDLAMTPQEALTLTSKVECIRKLSEELATLESGTNSDEIFIWRQNNKLYVSTREPDQTIIIAVNE